MMGDLGWWNDDLSDFDLWFDRIAFGIAIVLWIGLLGKKIIKQWRADWKTLFGQKKDYKKDT